MIDIHTGGAHMKRRTTLSIVLVSTLAVVALANGNSISGNWTSTDGQVTMNLKVDGKTLTGHVMRSGFKFAITEGKVTGSNTVSFKWSEAYPPEGRATDYSAGGKLTGDGLNLALTRVSPNGDKDQLTMTLKRSQ
jgi:hypothetical protein